MSLNNVNSSKVLLRVGSTLCLAALAVTGVVAIGTGIDDGVIFELDGNASVESTHDWNQVYADFLSNFTSNSAGAIVSQFIPDGIGAGDDILQGGTTKDTNDFPGWGWKQNSTTSVQDKDDIGHAFAAAYKLPNGHTGIFFGADRFSNSGDSQMGFWFVQDPNVAINHNATGGLSGGFNGHHMDGDLLIVSHFVNGGAVPQITLFKWDGPTNTIKQIGNPDNNLCNPATGSVPDICAITNGGAIGQTWNITEKASDSPPLTGLFIEGGIDLQAAIGGSPCFNVFFAETRSSQSPTATLSDFTQPKPFQLCTVDISKSCNSAQVQTLADGSNNVHYTFTGAVFSPNGTVFDPTVTDIFPVGAFNTKLGAGSNPANASTCTLDANNGCTLSISASGGLTGAGLPFSGSFDMPAPLPASNNNNPAGTNPNQVKATAAPNEGGPHTVTSKQHPWSPNDAPGQACNVPTPAALSITKGCTVNIVPFNGALALQVDAEIRICNTVPVSQGGVQVKGISLTDSVFGTLGTNLVLDAPSATQSGCLHFYPSMKPSTCSSTDGRCAFSDTATISSGVNDFGVVVPAPVPATASATCRVCPLGACSATSDTPFPDPGAKIVP
jgi:hypothetical protein